MSKRSVLALTLFGIAGCSFDARGVDPRQVPNGSAATGVGGVPGVAPGVPVAPGAVVPMACQIDTRTVVEMNGRFIEILTSRGRLFQFENGVPITTTVGVPAPSPVAPGARGLELSSIPLYAQGPCLGAPPMMCVFDTHAFVRLPEGRLLEYVTAGGRQWVFENNQMTGAGLPLAMIPRYQPICGPLAATGAPCVFDTRVFLKQGPNIVESITAFGRSFELDLDGNLLPNAGIDLMQSPRYAAGPCAGAAPGTCILETRTFEPINGALVETVTSRGLFFTYAAETGAPIQPGVPIATRPHWATGPCL